MSRRVNLADMLDGEPLNEPTHAAPRLPAIDLAQIAPNPENPRGAIDESDQDFQDLVTSVAEVGVITPLTVCTAAAFLKHHPSLADQIGDRQYIVVAGHRRLEAARKAGLGKVPAHVNDNGASDPLVWAVAENLLRVGLNPIQEAQTLSVLTDKPPLGRGMSQSKVARGIGKTQAFVSFRISLLGLAPELQEKVATGELGVKAARAFTSLTVEQQLTAYQESLRPADLRPAPVAPAATTPPARTEAAESEPVTSTAASHNPVMAPPAPTTPKAPLPAQPASPVSPTAGTAHGGTTPADALPSGPTSEQTDPSPVLTGDDPAPVPEPRAASGSISVPDVDWHDTSAFVAAIREVLSPTEVYELAEALIDSLR